MGPLITPMGNSSTRKHQCYWLLSAYEACGAGRRAVGWPPGQRRCLVRAERSDFHRLGLWVWQQQILPTVDTLNASLLALRSGLKLKAHGWAITSSFHFPLQYSYITPIYIYPIPHCEACCETCPHGFLFRDAPMALCSLPRCRGAWKSGKAACS